MIGEFSLMHWLVVFAIVLLVMGPKRLPELAKALGAGIRDFKKALHAENEDTAAPKALASTEEKKDEVQKAKKSV